jgi:hypothetical protein
MKTFTRRASLSLAVAITFSLPSASWGQGAGAGGGGGAGGGTAQAAGALYGDLYVIERDGNGVPALKEKTISGVKYTCQLPIAADCTFLPLNFDKLDFNPELEDACAVQAEFTDGLQEVKFGRESVSRAPATVLDKSYGEALKSINLATNGCGDSSGRAIKLDPAGRIALCLASETVPVTYAWKTIDAPLENLGLYRAAMTSGCLGPVTETKIGEEGVPITVTIELSDTAKTSLGYSGLGHLVCGAITSVTREDMLSAAVFLAAGADKTSPVTLDEVINLNNYVGVNKWTYTTSKKVKTLTITYFQFKVTDGGLGSNKWFGYTNGVDACNPGNPDNTVPLLAALNSTTFVRRDVSVFGGPPDGVNLADAAVTVCRNGSPLVDQDQARVVCDAGADNPVYESGNIYGCGGANWFTQAAEDARKTIWYVHNWRLPEIAY